MNSSDAPLGPFQDGVKSDNITTCVGDPFAAAVERSPALIKGEKPTSMRRKIAKYRKAATFWLELGTFIALIAYATITSNQWRESEKATWAATSAAITADKSLRDTERSLAATSAAECNPNLNSRNNVPYLALTVACQPGRVDAMLLSGSFEVGLVNPTNGKFIGERQPFTLKKELITPGGQSKVVNFDVQGFSESSYLNLSQAIIVDGSFVYDDGFGRQRSETFCTDILPFRSSNGVYGGMVMVECELANDTIRKYRETRRQK